MKCDELKDKWFNAYPEIMGIEGTEPTKCYGKYDVDAAIAELKAKLETVYDIVKTSKKFLDDAMEAPTFKKDKEISRLKESVKFFSDTLHRESDSAKECFRFLMDEGLICGWGLTDKFFVTSKYSKARLKEFESQDAENRKLKRALWLARAERAEARKNYWYVRSIHEGDKDLLSIDGSAVKYIGCIKRSNFDWLKIWSEVESKCRAKAKEYK